MYVCIHTNPNPNPYPNPLPRMRPLEPAPRPQRSWPQDIAEEANGYFTQIFHQEMSIPDAIRMLARFHDGPLPRHRQVITRIPLTSNPSPDTMSHPVTPTPTKHTNTHKHTHSHTHAHTRTSRHPPPRLTSRHVTSRHVTSRYLTPTPTNPHLSIYPDPDPTPRSIPPPYSSVRPSHSRSWNVSSPSCALNSRIFRNIPRTTFASPPSSRVPCCAKVWSGVRISRGSWTLSWRPWPTTPRGP